MKKLFSILLSASLLFSAVSCEKDPVNPGNGGDPIEAVDGLFVINNGSFGANNASLYYYDNEAEDVVSYTLADSSKTNDLFLYTNGKKLGDSAQDIVVYGSKVYISMYNSGVIFITNLQGEILREVVIDSYASPRSLTSYNGKVYASYYDGGVAQIDTANFDVYSAPCGINPEELEVANEKLYVAVSEGMNYPNYGKTLAVYSTSKFAQTATIEVGLNPVSMEANSNGDLYVICTGDYYTVDPSLKLVNSSTDEVSDVVLEVSNEDGTKSKLTPSWMAMSGDDLLYLVCAKEGDSWSAQKVTYVYNTKTKELEGKFITSDDSVINAYYISTDKASGDVYIGSSDYTNNGDMYIFSKDGVLKDSFETGINPIKVVAVSNK